MTLYIDLEWTPSLIGFIEDLQHGTNGQRGREYAEAGRVKHLTVSPDGLLVRAAVKGSNIRPYLTSLRLEGDHYLVSECSCPMEMDCKHGFALAMTLAGGAYRHGSSYQEQLKALLPAAWRGYGWNPPAGLFDGVAPLFARVSEPAAAAEPGAAPAPAKMSRQAVAAKKLRGKKTGAARAAALPPPPPVPVHPWWERLWNATTAQARERILLEIVEQRIGTARFYYPYDLVSKMRELGDSAAILVGLEEALAHEAAVARRPLRPPDPAYLAFRDSGAVQAAYRKYQEAKYNSYLREWIERAAPAPAPAGAAGNECRLELVWKLMPLPSGIDMVAFQLLISTAKMDRRPRKPQAIHQLANELLDGKRTTEGVMKELVDWLDGSVSLASRFEYNKPPWGDEGIIPIDNVLVWISAWGGRGVLHWEDGAAVAYDPRPARLAIRRAEGGQDLWFVEYPPEPGAGGAGDDAAPAGEALSATKVFADDSVTDNPYSTQERITERFYVRRGAVIYPLDAAGMDQYALGAARALGAAPVKMMLKRPQGMKLLRRLARGARGGEARAEGVVKSEPGLVREVAVQPVVELKALRDEWISVAVWGRSAEGTVFLRDPFGEWNAAPAGTPEAPFSNSAQSELAQLTENAEMEAPPEGGTTNLPPEGGAGEDARGPGALLLLPRMEELEPLEGWLRRVIPPHTAPLNHGQERYTFQWPATPGATAEVLRRWPERPPGATYLGNADFLKLITPAARPSLRVSVESAGMDWLAVSVEMEEELARLSARELRALLAASPDALVRLPNGRFYQREGLEEYERELSAIEEAGLAAGPAPQRLHALHLAGAAGQKLIELGDTAGTEHFAELARSARKLLEKFSGIPDAPIEPGTAAHLRPYQRAGADFLAWACGAFGGALLADDMGLGKTLEVLAALTALRAGEKKHKPSLVICPASVAHNWQREAARFAPGLRTLVIERGAGRKAHWEHLAEYDLVIKNYSLTRRDAEVVRKYDWLMVCVDEAQAIKNPASGIAGVVKSIPARYRVALTGTPIENRIGDLVSIMEFATPGFIPPLEGIEPDVAARRLRAWLRPVLLRRLKREVAPELPDRIEERLDCPMTENQRLAYLAEVRAARQMLRGLPGQNVVGPGRIQILAALTRLRQICCDPALVTLKDLGSGKVEELMNLLPPILEAGNKVLVFSQFVRMLHRLEAHMQQAKIPTYILTGHTKPADRLALVDRFERDETPSVFLISLKAGGTGLNLVSAAHVVLFDPWWNPAVEAQAIDRTHRIGQDKTVLALRLVTEGTIEERIMELQEKKKGLVQNVLEEEAFNRTLTREDFEFLLES